MSNVIVKRGPGRPKGSKNKVQSKTAIKSTIKRGRGRPKGSKNKISSTTTQSVIKRGRGRPKGSKNNKTIIELPNTNPSNEQERLENIAYMANLCKKGLRLSESPKRRGRKPKNLEFDEEKLASKDLDKDHFTYSDNDINDELSRTEAYQDFVANRSRYSESF